MTGIEVTCTLVYNYSAMVVSISDQVLEIILL